MLLQGAALVPALCQTESGDLAQLTAFHFSLFKIDFLSFQLKNSAVMSLGTKALYLDTEHAKEGILKAPAS